MVYLGFCVEEEIDFGLYSKSMTKYEIKNRIKEKTFCFKTKVTFTLAIYCKFLEILQRKLRMYLKYISKVNFFKVDFAFLSKNN